MNQLALQPTLVTKPMVNDFRLPAVAIAGSEGVGQAPMSTYGAAGTATFGGGVLEVAVGEAVAVGEDDAVGEAEGEGEAGGVVDVPPGPLSTTSSAAYAPWPYQPCR